MTPPSFRPTRAEIDLDAIRHNVSALGDRLGGGVERLAVVKANAYGHGDVEVARAAIDAGATWLGVALVEEGVTLRRAGIDVPIFVLVDPPPSAAHAVVEHRLTSGVTSRDSADALDAAAQAAGVETNVHLCIDTGMHREGVGLDDAAEAAAHLDGLLGVRLEGLWSHFAVADETDPSFTEVQIARFADACERIAAAGIDIPIRHLANSAGLLAHPTAHLNLVRMGIAMYGLAPSVEQRDLADLRAAMRLVSAVSGLRRVAAGEGVSYGLTYAPQGDATIANVPIGYGDGFSRRMSNNGVVLIGGRRRPVVGRVTMDTILVDCGDDDVQIGEDVVLIGTQGNEEITADEIADVLNTINYEVVCGVSARVPRVFLGVRAE